jgi:hypothetical protein
MPLLGSFSGSRVKFGRAAGGGRTGTLGKLLHTSVNSLCATLGGVVFGMPDKGRSCGALFGLWRTVLAMNLPLLSIQI